SKLPGRSLLPGGRQSYQRPIDPVDLIQKSAAFMKQLQCICAQTLDIGNGCADVLNGFPIFHCHSSPDADVETVSSRTATSVQRRDRLELRAPAFLRGRFARPWFPA